MIDRDPPDGIDGLAEDVRTLEKKLAHERKRTSKLERMLGEDNNRIAEAEDEALRLALIVREYERRGLYTKDGRKACVLYPMPKDDPVKDFERAAVKLEQVERERDTAIETVQRKDARIHRLKVALWCWCTMAGGRFRKGTWHTGRLDDARAVDGMKKGRP
jgi:hypothetical protein